MKRTKTMIIRYIIYALIVIALIAIDQLTKVWAFKALPENEVIDCLKPLFKFEKIYNNGAIFGILSGKMWLFYIFTFIGLGIFGYLMRYADYQRFPFYTVGLLLMIAGTIGNFIDRIAFGQVRDFLTFGFFNFAVFNFADMCMTCGIIALMIDILFNDFGALWK